MDTICTKFETPFGVVNHINCGNSNVTKKTNRLILLIDHSGSMAGAWLNNSKSALMTLLTRVNVDDIIVMPFNDSVNVFHARDIEQANNYISCISSSAGTNFELPLKEAISYIEHEKNTTVLMTTDGEAYSGCTDVGLNLLSKHIQSLRGGCVEIHCIGFTNSSDVKVLVEIANSGTIRGTVQYVREYVYINDVVENIIELIGPPPMLTYTVEDTKFHISNNILMGEIPPNAIFYMDGEKLTFTPVKGDLMSADNELFQDVMMKIMQSISTRASSDDRVKIKQEFLIVEQMLQERISKRCDKCVVSEKMCNMCMRIYYISTNSEEYKLLKQHLVDMLKVFSESIESRDLSRKLLTMGYAPAFDKRKFASQLYKQKLRHDDFTCQLLKKEFRKRPLVVGDEWKEIQCAINTTSIIDEHNEGGVLCITFNHKTSDVCVVAPHKVQIKEVYNLWLSFEAFLSTINFANPNQKMEQLKGLVPYTNSVEVTGVMPIFVSEEQWEDLGSKYMQAAVGVTVTGNLDGFTTIQVNALPFLVWLTNWLAEPVEWRTDLDKHLIRTCKQYLPKDMAGYAQNFLENYANRLPEAEPYLPLFLAKLVVADINILPFSNMIFEEYARRTCKGNYNVMDFFIQKDVTKDVKNGNSNLDLKVKKIIAQWQAGNCGHPDDSLSSINPSSTVILNEESVSRAMNELQSRWKTSDEWKIFEKKGFVFGANIFDNAISTFNFLYLMHQSSETRRSMALIDYSDSKLMQDVYNKQYNAACSKLNSRSFMEFKDTRMGLFLEAYLGCATILEAAALISLLDEWEIKWMRKAMRQPGNSNSPHNGVKLSLLSGSFVVRTNNPVNFIEVDIEPRPFKTYYYKSLRNQCSVLGILTK